MSYSLNSLKGGGYIGDYIGDIKGDTRSLDYSSYGVYIGLSRDIKGLYRVYRAIQVYIGVM